MRLQHIRILGLASLFVVLYFKAWLLLFYWTPMMLSLEILNRSERYRAQLFYRVYNFIFMSYLLLVVADRVRQYHLQYAVEWFINSLMHILFGVLICFKISQYIIAFDLKIKYRVWAITLIFNAIGVINEYLQNIMVGRATWVIIPEAQKDLAMNLIGTILFVSAEYIFSRKSTPSVS